MPLDLEQLAPILGTLFVGASTLLLTAAIGWRLAVKPTMRALMELRATRDGRDPQLARRVAELEDEVRSLKAQLTQLPEVTGSRALAEVPWRGSRDRA
jgi:hypothetical protein